MGGHARPSAPCLAPGAPQGVGPHHRGLHVRASRVGHDVGLRRRWGAGRRGRGHRHAGHGPRQGLREGAPHPGVALGPGARLPAGPARG
eukprot:204295-Lingulodinium_polyedra.AAC.1